MDKFQRIINKINKRIIGKNEICEVVKVLKSGFLSRPGGGPSVHQFQSLMAKKHDKKYAYATISGTASLHLAISALELQTGDEVIIPALANIADCSVVMQEGINSVFADVDAETFNVDPKDIERKITPKTKAIIAVHIYGEPVNIKEIKSIAKKHNLVLIEDCAQAAGAKYDNRYVGSFGDITCFSFYQTKHIITGEGGMILTDNEEWVKIVDSLANNGIKKDNVDAYDYDRVGYNYQMTEMQATLGIVQFEKIDKLNKIRRRNAETYKKQLKNIDIIFQKTNNNSENAYFYLTGLLPDHLAPKRNEFLANLRSRGVPVKNLYPLSLPEVELLRGKVNDDCPIAKNITKRLFNVFVNPGLDTKDIIRFSKIIKEEYNNIAK